MLILRRQNQRFETLIQNADPKRPSREYCSCFPREEDDFVSMHCALFEAIVRAQVNRKGVYMTSFKRGYMWFCVHASTRISVFALITINKRTFLGCVHAYFAKAESAFWNADSKRRSKTPFTGVLFMLPSRRRRFREHALRIVRGYCSSSSEPERRLYDVIKRGYMWFCVHASTRISVLL